MTRNSRRALVFSGLVSMLALGGCATTQEYDDVRAMAEQASRSAAEAKEAARRAQSTADAAMKAATDAKSCCTNTNEKIDRMFKKSMYK